MLWACTTFISVATLQYYNTNGMLPGYENIHNRRTHNMNNIDPDKAAFSTGPVDEEGVYAPLGGGRNDHDDDDDEQEFNAGPYGSGNGNGHGTVSSTSAYGGASAMAPNDPHDPNAFGAHHHQYAVDTSYGGAGAAAAAVDTSYGGSGSMGSRYDDIHTTTTTTGYAPHVVSPPPAGTQLYSPPPLAHGEDEYDRPAQFPSGNYDNIGLRQV